MIRDLGAITTMISKEDVTSVVDGCGDEWRLNLG